MNARGTIASRCPTLPAPANIDRNLALVRREVRACRRRCIGPGPPWRSPLLWVARAGQDILPARCSIEMFPEDGCLSAYDNYPASELTEHIVLFTEDGIENLKYIIEGSQDRRITKSRPPIPQR